MIQTAILLVITQFFVPVLSGECLLHQARTLADRGQFAAAIAFCQENIKLSDADEIDKIRWATELVRIKAMQLLTLEPDQQVRSMKQLNELEAEFLASRPGEQPYELELAKITLRLQFAMAESALGNYQRFEAESEPASKQQEAFLQARKTLQNTVDRLRKCQKEIQAFRNPPEFSSQSLRSDYSPWHSGAALESSIMMQQGIAQKLLAQTFSTESDRIFELRRAADIFSGIFPNTPPPNLSLQPKNESAVIACKIEQSACFRLIGDFARCREILTPLLEHSESACRVQAQTEWIRLLIAEGNIGEARQKFDRPPAEVRQHPEFYLALMEMYLANNGQVKPNYAAAVHLQETIDRLFGSYWARRARFLMNKFNSGRVGLLSAEMIGTLAEDEYREGRFVESADLYEQAAVKADENRQAEQVFQYRRFAAGALQKMLEQLPADADKSALRKRLQTLFRKSAMQQPKRAEAVQLHFGAIAIQQTLYEESPELLDDFAAIVEEHLAVWKESPHTESLQLLLAMLLDRQGRVEDAAAILVTLESANWKKVSPPVRRCAAQKLADEGKTEDVIGILTGLLSKHREPETLQLSAEVLARQTKPESLRHALDLWMELERKTAKNSETWWSAREGIIDTLCKLNRRDEAEQSLKMLQTLYPGLGGEEVKNRLNKLLAK